MGIVQMAFLIIKKNFVGLRNGLEFDVGFFAIFFGDFIRVVLEGCLAMFVNDYLRIELQDIYFVVCFFNLGL